MGRLSASVLALALGAASAVALVSCGGGSDAALLPGTTASQIESNLDQIDQLVAEGDCVGAEDSVAAVSAEVEGLNGVDQKLKAALQEGTTRLSEVVSRCQETEETEPALESDVEAEEPEEEKKSKKEKPEKEAKEPAEPTEQEEGEGPTLPPQSNGKGEEKGKGGGPPSEPEAETAPSGGVGPSVGVE
jgi:hypothetical protein